VTAAPRNFFGPIAEFLGPAYLRNAFTMGTEQEVGFLVDALGLEPGMKILDVGCGPGRHALALARRGFDVTGVDLSPEFVELANDTATAGQLPARFEVLDVRELEYNAEFDTAICLCQGGFGLLGGRDDEAIIGRIARAVRTRGAVAISAFHSYFAVRFLEEGDTFDPANGVNHERATVRNDAGQEREFDLWTTCFTAREMELMAHAASLDVQSVSGVSPGQYGAAPPALEDHEVLLLARRR
jgi:SAM-dependent methyltransferase